MIAEKLDFIMKVTNTKNSTLGRALSFDSSYIGRIRSGKRGLPKNQAFIEPAAEFFARNLCEPYQKATIAEAVFPGRPWPEDREEAKALLISWFSHRDSFGNPPAGDMPFEDAPSAQTAGAPEKTLFSYGNSGKRLAVETFLTELCASGGPHTLLLYSDEDMSWLYENGDFAARWSSLLLELISNGTQIRIIHTVSRGTGEILEAVEKWLPLYATGAIHPYFYPKLRDGIIRRTLFIARGSLALTANSVGSHTQETLNILTRDPGAVRALEAEFTDYFAMCRPLMKVFDLRNSDDYRKTLAEFEKSPGNLITALPVFSHFTMPPQVIESMAARTGSRQFAETLKASSENFREKLARGYTAVEILHLPPPEAVKAGKVSVPMCDLFGQPGLCYTADEFCAHLESAAEFLRREEGYRIVLSDSVSKNILLFAKEDTGTIFARSAAPTTVFGISEQNMTAAFWEFLWRLAAGDCGREKTIRSLEEYLKRAGEPAAAAREDVSGGDDG